MIPYFDIATFHLGPITLYTWGFVVSIGIAVALAVAYQRCKSLALSDATKLSFGCQKLFDLAFWILIAAFVGARLFHVFLYEWPYYRLHLGEIWRIDQGGLSSFGGFIGAVVGFWWYTRKHRIARINYADLLMFVWPLGHGLGRIGCFLVHMHPGRLSTVPWALQYPGGARLDMGLIEAVVLLLYCAIVKLFFRKKEHFNGFYVVAGMIFYGAARFILDFFRATDLPMSDARYLGLTPAQYGSIALLIGGLYLLAYKSRAWKTSRS